MHNRPYKLLAIILSAAIFITSIIPLPVLQNISDTTNVVYAASNTTNSSSPFDRIREYPYFMHNELGNIGFPTNNNSEPEGMLLDAQTLRVADNLFQTHVSGTPSVPIVVSHIQSAFTSSNTFSNTLTITFTVTNNKFPSFAQNLDLNSTFTESIKTISELDFSNDPNTIKNVVLTDKLLLSDTAFISSSIPLNNDGDVFIWNLGDIPPNGDKTLTLKLSTPTSVTDFTELDIGAAVYGTLNGHAISANATPIILVPDEFESWLVCTIDANCYDEFIITKAAELGNDPVAIFKYVQSLSYESYMGSLRGARGTLWGKAGNSIDQASLLIAMLRASGIPASYRHGFLEDPDAQKLILSMFSKDKGVIGHIPDGTKVADPANDPYLLTTVRDHWWVQAYLPTTGWIHMDPSFLDSQIGDSFTLSPEPERFAEIPDSLRHKITIKVKVEEYHPTNFSGTVSGLTYSYPLVQNFNSVELVGKPISFGHFITSDSQGGAVFHYVQNSYTPYFSIDDSETYLEGATFHEMISNFPLGTFIITGEWLLFEIQGPDNHIELYEREIIDRIGYEERINGDTFNIDENIGTEPAITEFDIFTILAMGSDTLPLPDLFLHSIPSFVADLSQNIDTFNLSDIDASLDDNELNLEASNQARRQISRINSLTALSFASSSSAFKHALAESFLTKAYLDSPNIIISSFTLRSDGLGEGAGLALDLLRNKQRVEIAPGQTSEAKIATNYLSGTFDSFLESQTIKEILGDETLQVQAVADVMQAADTSGILLIPISIFNLDDLANLEISDLAKARITKAVDEKTIIVVPEKMVILNGIETTGWWQIDISSGETISVMENGLHSAFANYTKLAVSSFFASFSISFLYTVITKIGAGLVAWAIVDIFVRDANDKEAAYFFWKDFLNKTFSGALALGGLGAAGKAKVFQKILLKKIAASTNVNLAGVVTSVSLLAGWVAGMYASEAFMNNVDGFLIDPPLPNLQIIRPRFIHINNPHNAISIKAVNVLGSRPSTNMISATLQTRYSTISNTLSLNWEAVATNSLLYTTLENPFAQILDTNGLLLTSGPIQVIPLYSSSHIYSGANEIQNYSLTGKGIVSFYAPALSELVSGSIWQIYTASLSSTQPYTLTLENAVVTVNNTDTYTGSFTIVTSEPTTIQGSGHTAVPNFADSVSIQAQDSQLTLGPATGSILVGGQPLDASNGLALAGYTGPITITEATTMTDQVELNGNAHFFTLHLSPNSSITDPNTAVTFQTVIDANFDDTYTTTVEAPVGWDVQLGATGLVTATPPLGATPGDYAMLVTAQSSQYPDLFVSAIHTVSTTDFEGMQMAVAEDPLITVPVGPLAPNSIPGDTNTGQMQLTEAAYTIDITNTSTVSHTFDINVSGLPAGWLILSGAEGDTATSITLPAGGVGQIGLYISPTLPLPAVGSEFPFNVTATAVDNPTLSQSNTAVFTMPAVPFNYVTVAPPLTTAAPGTTATLDISLSNVGNAPGSFPVAATTPDAGWIVSHLPSPISLLEGGTASQTIQLTIPPDAEIGRLYILRLDSPAPGTAYTQTTYAAVQVVTTQALPIYQTAAKATPLFPSGHSLTAALQRLALDVDDLTQSCQTGTCDLVLRNRVAASTQQVAVAAAPELPGVAAITTLQQLHTDIAGHSDTAVLLTDLEAIAAAITELCQAMAALQHRLTATFVPGVNAVLDDGSSAAYILRVGNTGSLPTTAVITLTAPSGTTTSWNSHSALLQPGETITIPTTITPTGQGIYILKATVSAAETPLVQRQARASLNVVDAFVRVLNVTADPPFVDTGSSSTTLSVDIANIANVFQAATAQATITAPNGSSLWQGDTPLNIATGAPHAYALETVDTSGWAAGVYTMTVELLDDAGMRLADGYGFGHLYVGQALRPSHTLSPAVVPPGNITVTTHITTQIESGLIGFPPAATTSPPADPGDPPPPSPVTTGPAVTLAFNPSPGQIDAGSPISLTVTAYDELGNVANGYTGTVILAPHNGNLALGLTPAQLSASSQYNSTLTPAKVVDGNPSTEWATAGELAHAWIQLDFEHPLLIDRVVLRDRANSTDHVKYGYLYFSDGSSIPVNGLPNNGSPQEVTFSARMVDWVRFYIHQASGQNIGLAEFEVYPATYTFTSGSGGDNGQHTFYPIVLTRLGNHSISVHDTAASTLTDTITIDVTTSPFTRHEENASTLLYNGLSYETRPASWETLTNSQLSQGQSVGSQTQDDSLTFTFSGEWLQIGILKCPRCGQAEIAIDGVVQETIDAYNIADTVASYIYANLSSGTHTLSITVLNQHHPNATDAWIYLDYLDVWDGTITERTLFEEYDPHIYFSEDWTSSSRASASQGTYVQNGSHAWFNFVGNDLTYAAISYQGGPANAELFIDGVSQGIVNLQDSFSPARYTFHYPDLGSGPHAVHISGLNHASLDAFDTSAAPLGPSINVEWYDAAPDGDWGVISTIAAGDIDYDGLVEIIVPSFDNTLYVYRGDGEDAGNGTPLLWSYPIGSNPTAPALANLDNNGGAEIVIGSASGLHALHADGTLYWLNNSIRRSPYTHPVGATIGNLDDTLNPEIVASSSNSGLCVLTYDGTIAWCNSTLTGATVPVLADLTGDGYLDIITAKGNTLYLIDYDQGNAPTTVWTWTTSASGAFGAPAVADIDGQLLNGEPGPEIVMVWDGRVEVVHSDGSLLWSYALPGSFRNGSPAVADTDGDGEVEIVISTDTSGGIVLVLNADGSLLWQTQAKGHVENAAISVHDFNGDGIWEVVWNGNVQGLTIYRGSNGEILYNEPLINSITFDEYPIVADVDGDGYAEIVTGDSQGMYVIGNDGNWAAARPLWNQHNYHVTNINDDLTVPPQEPDSWLLHNTYRTQTPLNEAAPVYAVNLTHTVAMTGVQVLVDTFSAPPTISGFNYHWDYSQYWYQAAHTTSFMSQLPDMQPGEVRQVSTGTEVAYQLPSGGNRVTLPPLYAAAPHLISVEPPVAIVSLGSTAVYTVHLHNPTSNDMVLTMSVAGLPEGWATLGETITVTANSELSLPLTILAASGEVREYAFAVIVETDNGGQDQVGALLQVTAPTATLSLAPKVQLVANSEALTYTATLTNLDTTEQTYNLSLAGLSQSLVTLPPTVTVSAGSAAEIAVNIQAYDSYGPHPVTLSATAVANESAAQDSATLTILGDTRVTAGLSPAAAVSGPGTPATYTLTIANQGTLSDTYTFSLDLLAGWTYRLDANGREVNHLSLTPHVFNEAGLLLIVTPAVNAVTGNYDISVTVQSASNPAVNAVVPGTLTVTEYGVQVDIQPDSTVLSPTDTGIWQITITNTGSVPDTYELSAGGIVAGSAQLPATVSLAPGGAQTVQMTAGEMDFALVHTYPLAVFARSQTDGRIQNQDIAHLTFTGYEAVETAWLPAGQTLTDTNEIAFMLLVTNTGNVSTLYDLSVVAAGLQMTLETDQAYIPPHMTAGILVSLRATEAGTFTLTGTAASTTSAVSDSANATLVVAETAVPHPPTAVDDVVAAKAGEAVIIDVLANDSDLDGDTLTVIALTQPLSGTAVLNPDSTITYTSTLTAVGIDSFSYTISDGNGGTDMAVVSVSLNHDPVAADDAVTTNEDTTVTIPVLANDNDLDGDTLAVISTTLPVSGTAVLNLDQTVTYTPTLNAHGVDTFSYTLTDGRDGFSTAMVTVAITPVNDPPVAVDDTAVTDEDVPVTMAVLSNDSDVDGDMLTVSSLTQPGNGTTVLNPDGTITYTPDADFNSGDSANGTDSFTYTASDGNGASAAAAVVITVNPVNDAPIAADDMAVTNEDTAVTVTVLANDSDVDSDALTVTAVTTPTNGTVLINPDLTITYTPNANYHGLDSFAYSISDDQGATASAAVTMTINPVNDPPHAADDALNTLEDEAVTIDVLANDTDVEGNALTVSAVTTPTNGAVVINLDHTVTYTPAVHFFGPDSFTYTAADGQGGMDTATVVITVTAVNDAPVAVDDASATAEETTVIIDVLANDSDADGDALTVTAVTLPTNGIAAINLDSSVAYTPALNFVGSDVFTYTVSDGQGSIDTASVTVTVSNENDNPVAADDAATTAEDTAIIIDALANDSDVDGDALAITAVTPPTNGIAVINPDSSVTYTPHTNYYGPDSFSYTISDGQGGADTAVVMLTVTPVNDPPLAMDDTTTTNEDTVVTVDVLANDSDADGDTLTVTVTIAPALGTAVVSANGMVLYTPNANDHGVDSFIYTLADGHGGTDTAMVQITIVPVNDAPEAANDTASTNEDTTVTVNVLANDSDTDGDTLTLAGVSQPAHGTVAVNLNGSLTYTPTANYHGADSFTYTVNDGNGGTDTALVTVAVNPVNDPPVANNDAATTAEDTVVTINALANDSDVDGDLLQVTSATMPTHGLVVINSDNSLTYTPEANFHGQDSFSYTISDGHNEMDTAIVTVTVTAVNDAPVAVADAVVTDEDTAVTLAVLANDTDVDGDILTITAVTPPTNGTVVIHPDNSLTYTPTAGFNGTDSFAYTVSDGQGGSDTANVLVTITAVNDNPEAADDTAVTAEDTAVTIEVLLNDTDIDGDVLVISSLVQPANGTAVIEPDNRITYTPNANNYGTDSFAYTVNDGNGGSDTAVVTVLVQAVNDPPTAIDDTAATDQDTAVTIVVLANDSDVDGDPLTVSEVGQPGQGTLLLNGDNSLTYTPNTGFSGTDTFTYTIIDGNGGSDTAVVTIDVRPVATSCNLYPIALHADVLMGIQPGDTLPDILNGTQPGNFGWLTWTGDNGVPALVASLTPPGNSHTYINPDNPNDHVVSIGDWVEGKPGVSNAKDVRNALDALIGTDIVVPVWDATEGNGANTVYRVSGFALVRILDYKLPGQDRITVQFLGLTSCSGN